MHKLLIVDDEPLLVEILIDELSLRGYAVVGATSGQEALTLLENERFDLVISDVRMPKMSGLQLLDKTKSLSRQAPLFILVSGFSDISQAEAIGKGALGLFAKPYQFDEILSLITDSLAVGP